jgi:hypothetical protein
MILCVVKVNKTDFKKINIINLILMKKLTSILSLVLFFLSATYAADVWDGTTITAFSTAGGAGSSASNPILIQSAAQLAYLAQETNKGAAGGGSDYTGVYFKMTTDIDLNNNEWTPIGWHSTNTNNRHFKGNFDGYGHSITNLKISTAKSGTTAGLFGAINSGYIKNLAISSGSITWGGSVGGVVGSNFSGTVSGCSNAAYMKGTAYVGGVSGYNVKASGSVVFPIVTNCYNRGAIELNNGTNTTNRALGGVAGQATAYVSNVYNYGILTVLGTDIAALKGGVIGVFGPSASVNNSYYKTGTVAAGANAYGTATDEADMKLASFVTTINNSQSPAVWVADDAVTPVNNGYPVLSFSPVVVTSVSALTDLNYHLGKGPSAEQSFTVSGNYLTNDIAVSVPTNYEISLTSGSAFSSQLTLVPTLGDVSTTTIYVRLKEGLTVNSYNGSISVTSTGATSTNITLSGTVDNTTGFEGMNQKNKISVNGLNININGFTGLVEVFNVSGSVALSGKYVSSDCILTMPNSGVYFIRMTNNAGVKVQKISL